MTRRLRVAPAVDEASAVRVLRSLAAALAPFLREHLDAERGDGAIVDVLEFVPGSRRTIQRACRTGAIEGARKVGRRWVATRGAIDGWLRSCGPRLVPSTAKRDGDDLESMRERLARGGA